MSKITTYGVFDKWWLATQTQPLNKSITKTSKWPPQPLGNATREMLNPTIMVWTTRKCVPIHSQIHLSRHLHLDNQSLGNAMTIGPYPR